MLILFCVSICLICCSGVCVLRLEKCSCGLMCLIVERILWYRLGISVFLGVLYLLMVLFCCMVCSMIGVVGLVVVVGCSGISRDRQVRICRLVCCVFVVIVFCVFVIFIVQWFWFWGNFQNVCYGQFLIYMQYCCLGVV